MKKCNTKIITLSGDPGSGKGSVSKKLNKNYEAQGFKSYIVSVGDLCRKIVVREYKKKFPEAENPSLDEIYGDPAFAKDIKRIDENMDNEIANLVEKFYLQSNTGEVLILDSRRAAIIIEKLAEKIPGISQSCFNVRLETDAKTAGERVFNDLKRGAEDQYSSLEEAIQDTASRREKEIQSCIKQYGKDISDHTHFDLIIGTTLASIEDIAQTIQVCEELKRQGKPFAKTWASPELFYPTQNIRETWSNHPWTAGFRPEELAELIKQNGIYPDAPVYSTTITNSPYQFVADGHHRVFASIMAGQTLIPYKATKNNNKATVSSQRALSQIYDHEDIKRPDGSSFRYAEYPEVDTRSNDEHDKCY